MASNEFKEGAPARQGFYRVRLHDLSQLIGEWKEYDKKEGKRWWTYSSDDPTVDKTRVPLEGVRAYAKVDDSVVQRFLARQNTRAENIDAAYRLHTKSREGYPAWKPIPMPDSRRFVVGQKVVAGNHYQPVVAGLYDDGQVVVVEHEEVKTKGGVDVPTGNMSYSPFSWVDVLPVAPTKTGLVRPRRLAQSEMTTQIGLLVQRLVREGASDSPDYQRKYVWTPKDKTLYLDTLFNGRNLGRFVFVVDSHSCAVEVLDGKQRLNTLLELISGVLPYQGVYWHELDRGDRMQLMTQLAQFVDLQSKDYSRLDLLQIFMEVNAAGVPQTEEHLDYVRGLIAQEKAKRGIVD